MPKKRQKRGAGGAAVVGADTLAIPGQGGRDVSVDRATVFSDVASVVSHVSLEDEDEVSPDGEQIVDDEVENVNLIEDRIKENFDDCSSKSLATREKALQDLKRIFSCQYLPDFLLDQKLTCVDGLERALKRSGAGGTACVLRLASLLCIQLGSDAREALTSLANFARPLIADPAKATAVRSEASLFIAIYVAFACEEPDDTQRGVDRLETVWSNMKVGMAAETHGPIFCAALQGWSLLLWNLPSNAALAKRIPGDIARLSNFLDATSIEVRLAAGEALACLYELARTLDPNCPLPPAHGNIVNKLTALAADSAKYHSRSDRRLQRATVRQIFSALREGTQPDLKVKFGKEFIVLETWRDRLIYELLCDVVGSGMHVQLKSNLIIRDVFDLGPPLLKTANQTGMSKAERAQLNASISKQRTVHRGKQRDKRVAVVDNDM